MSREDNISDSWENYADDSELEKRLQKERQEMSLSAANGVTDLSNGSDNFKPRILQRPQPKVQQNQIKILKRPESAGNLASTLQSSSKQKEIKTLEQREKEYAEARKRILGSECEDQVNKQVVYTKVSPSSSSNNLQSYNQPQQQRIPDNVIRQPEGPSTSNPGFRIRR